MSRPEQGEAVREAAAAIHTDSAQAQSRGKADDNLQRRGETGGEAEALERDWREEESDSFERDRAKAETDASDQRKADASNARSEGGASEEPPALRVRGLTHGFAGGAKLFDGLSFDIRRGEFAALLAPSGMGKTTLFRLLAGLLQPDSGVIEGEEGKLQRIGYMPQRDCLMPWRTVQDNAALGLELSGVPRREARRQVRELLPAFGLEGTELKRPHELSGGMRQRVSFLRSLLSGGDPLLLDEPFSALDAMTRAGMQDWLLQIWESHRKTVLFITHDVDEALLLSDRVLVAASSPIAELIEHRVGLKRPRSYRTVLEPEFIELKRRIMEQLGRFGAAAGGGQ